MKEEMKNKTDIGKTFKEAFKDYSIEPAPEVWENVSARIPHTSATGFSAGKGLIAGIGAALIIAVVAVFIFTGNNKDKENQTVKADTEQPAVKPVSSQTAVSQTENQPQNTETTDVEKPENNPESVVSKHDAKEISPEVSTTVKQEKVKLSQTEDAGHKNVSPAGTEKTKNEKVEPAAVTAPVTAVVTKDKDTKPIPEADITPAKNESPKRDTTIKFSDDPVICFGEDAVLEVFGGESYKWNTGDIMSKAVMQPVGNSTYTVTVTDKYGSQHVHEFHVTVDNECTAVFIPSAFSPNGDGNNDVFRVYGKNITGFKISIMNRQGQLVYTSNNIDLGWDGTFKGELLPSQVFVYTVIYTNSKGKQYIKKGQFTLIR
jgi:gliding motility-associated-like protein